MQLKLELLSSAGVPATKTAGAPGDQGAAVAGMQGCGVKLPRAAAVAAATSGLARLWHRPKGAMFSIGTWSLMLPTGTPAQVKGRGVALKLAGELPIEQLIWAPVQQDKAIAADLLKVCYGQ